VDQDPRNLFEKAQAVDAIAPRGGVTSKPAGRARGMAHDLTLLTMRRRPCDAMANSGLGSRLKKGVLDVAEAATRLHLHAPATVDDLLQNEDGPSLNALADAALQSNLSERAVVGEPSIAYGPVVTRPEKIVCVGLNYRRHAKAVNLPIPQQPVLFSKFNNSQSAHKHDVKLPLEVAHKFDYETELVIVMGKNAKTPARRTRSPTWQAIR
jgi:Fumarylacetoacetate (FAA) hydrolase family